MQIIVEHGKHGESYHDASTPEAWAASALAILTDRFRSGHYYYDPRQESHPFSLDRRAKRDEALAITDEQIEAIPSEEAREILRKKRASARRDKAYDDKAIVEYENIKAIVEAQDSGFMLVGRQERRVPKAWLILDDRSDHEYERVELVKVNSR